MNWIELIALIAILLVIFFASPGSVSAHDLEKLRQRTEELFDEANAEAQTWRDKAAELDAALQEERGLLARVRDAAQVQSYEVDRLKVLLTLSNQALALAFQAAQRNQQAATNWESLMNTLRTMIHRNEEALNPMKVVPADASAPDDRRQSP